MAETAPETKPETGITSEQFGSLEKAIAAQNDLIAKSQQETAELKKQMEEVAKQPVYKGFNPNGMYGGAAPYGTSGALGERGYSLMRAQKFALGYCTADQAKEEVQISQKLAKMYAGYNWTSSSGGSMLVPVASYLLPHDTTENESIARECRQKMLAGVAGYDPDEVAWLQGRMTKALGTISDLAGGALVGAPMLSSELIELQRNLEVFPRIGAREIPLPPNGRMQFPKQTAGGTAYWVGESNTITDSQPSTGNLTLEAKKLAVLTKVNNELFRFANPAAEAMIRQDNARVAALKADLAMLEGTGGTQIKGIVTYSDIGTLTATTTGAAGDTFQPEDVARMEGQLPDAIESFSAYVMRRQMAVALTNRRADAVTAGDGKGRFMFDTDRPSGMGVAKSLGGTALVRSGQVSGSRTKGGATNLTYILGCTGSEWIIARLGVMEILFANQGDTALVSDQTWIRTIQHLDAGPRHAASFVLCDQLRVA